MFSDHAAPAVVIWRSAMLAGSETFIRDHGDALTRWRPVYLGATRTVSPLARDTDRIAYPHPADRLAFLRLRLTGLSPRLVRLLAVVEPRLVHAHFGGDGWLVSGSTARLGVPLVVTVHGHDVTRQPARPGPLGLRYRRNLRTVFDRAHVILAVSAAIRDRAVACGADPAKVRVHHTGVPIPVDVPIERKRWDVAFVGRLVAKKGTDDLISALAVARARGGGRPTAVIIGDGPLAEPLRVQAARLGVDVTFMGAQPPGVVRHHLSRSRILAAPSKTAPDGDTEGLPTTVLEAAALGLPVVATRHSGIPEAVVDGETGLLGPEADPPALARAITRLLADEQLRERLSRNARAHVAARFNLETQTRQLENLYDEVVAHTVGRPWRTT